MNYFEGEKVRLRAVEPSDWETFSQWDLDTDAARRSYNIPFPQSQAAVRRKLEERSLQKPDGDVFRFVIVNKANAAVGTINTHSCDARSGTFKYGLGIGREHQRKGYAAEAIRLVLRYYFLERRYQKATAHVYSFNEASIRLHERLGFQLEGRLRRMYYTGGEFHDELVFGMTAAEFAALYLKNTEAF